MMKVALKKRMGVEIKVYHQMEASFSFLNRYCLYDGWSPRCSINCTRILYIYIYIYVYQRSVNDWRWSFGF